MVDIHRGKDFEGEDGKRFSPAYAHHYLLLAKQMKGRPVTYGDHLRLKHTERQAFLRVDISQAPKIKSSTKRIYLSVDQHDLVKFKILPQFCYLTEGNTVCFGDSFSLASADHPFEYLHASVGFTSE